MESRYDKFEVILDECGGFYCTKCNSNNLSELVAYTLEGLLQIADRHNIEKHPQD